MRGPPPRAPAGEGEARQAVLTVSALTALVRRAVEAEPGLKNVSVEGEISNWKPYPSGHIYFTLKDDESVIDAVFFQGVRRLAGIEIAAGARVVATGDVRVYPQRGKYQLYVSAVRPAGVGALWAAFEALKRKLAAEGLTARERKRALPRLPRRIGLVTSTEGAAIRDILHVIGRRFPLVEVVVRPVPVQGREAAPAVAAGVVEIARSGLVDLVIVGRGGGSIEDLWAFNEEVVARAIAASPVPVVSAVGHETDITIADLVADLRAPTPSAAAEIAVPAREDLLAALGTLARRAFRTVDHALARAAGDAEALRLALRSPRQAIDLRRERLDRAAGDLAAAARDGLASRRAGIEALRRRLAARSPAARLAEARRAADLLRARADSAGRRKIDLLGGRLGAAGGRLEAVSPLAVLGRGYSVVFDARGRVLRRAADARPGDEIRARLHEGEIGARVVSSRS